MRWEGADEAAAQLPCLSAGSLVSLRRGSERCCAPTITLTMNVYSHVIPALQRDAADRMDAMLGVEAG